MAPKRKRLHTVHSELKTVGKWNFSEKTLIREKIEIHKIIKIRSDDWLKRDFYDRRFAGHLSSENDHFYKIFLERKIDAGKILCVCEIFGIKTQFLWENYSKFLYIFDLEKIYLKKYPILVVRIIPGTTAILTFSCKNHSWYFCLYRSDLLLCHWVLIFCK